MHVEVILDTGGAAVAGIDQQRLVDDIQAELDKLTSKGQTESAKAKRTRPPPGAQGDWASFHWVIDFVTDPKMAPVYARAVIYALNTILQSAGFKKSAASKKSARSKKSEVSKGFEGASKAKKQSVIPAEQPVRITVRDKEFLLPATTAAINAFLKHLGEG
jgi:hypothetical protein